jgi:hypothetical protein
MTPEQILEARAITQALTPSDGANGLSSFGPAVRINKFEAYLRKQDISVEVFLGLDVPSRTRYAELVLQVDRNTHAALVRGFADHSATSPEERIPGY